MGIAYLAVTIILAAMAVFSGVGKLRHGPKTVRIVHEVVDVPLNYFDCRKQARSRRTIREASDANDKFV